MSNASKIIRLFTSSIFTPALKEKVWKWILSPAHQQEKEESMREIWDESKWEANESTQRSYAKFRERTAVKGNKNLFFTQRLMRIAALFLLPLLTGAAVYFYMEARRPLPIEFLECVVPEGECKEITLPDGSEIQLNAGTVLIYPSRFASDTRSVYLAGEGRFKIVKNKKHPFIVKTNHLNVQVLGTTFNLKAYPADKKTKATLETGSVAIRQAGGKNVATLLPNEQLEYNNQNGTFNKKSADAAIYSGWTKGELNFVLQSLKEIMITLERSYGITILISPDLVSSDLYTIKFKQRENINEVMNIVTKTIGSITYQMVDEATISIYSSLGQKGEGNQ